VNKTMKHFKRTAKYSVIAATFALTANAAHASIIISEVDPTGSSTSTYKQDWFELTNTGTSAIDITGWKVDDDSAAFSSAVLLRGVSSIGAGQSIVFIENGANAATDAALNATYKSTWFGANAPAGFIIGNYGGSGIGLGANGDAVNIYNATGTLITGVSFGVSSAGFTFDNKAGLTGPISALSTVNLNGAFTSANGAEVGSPGVVPVPAALPLLMSALGFLGTLKMRTKRKLSA